MVFRLSRHSLLLALSVALLAPTARAQAPQREKIALHPCVITGGKRKAEVSELEAICATAAVRETMNLVPSSEVRAFLDKETRGSCAKAKNRNACLGRLAAATQATRTLYITLNPFTPKSTRITGLVVNEAGKKVEERSLELPRLPNQPPSDAIRFAVAQLLGQLDVAKAPPQEVVPLTLEPQPEPIAIKPPPPEPTPTVAPPPPPVAVATQPAEPPRGRTWKTPAGISGMAAGAAGLGVAALLGSSSNRKAKEFNEAYAGGALPPQSELARLDRLRDQAQSQRRMALITAGAGAALAVGGTVLWLTDRPSSPKESPKVGSARLLAGPGQVGILVLLP